MSAAPLTTTPLLELDSSDGRQLGMPSMQGGELGSQPFRHSTLTFLMPIHLFISAKPSKVQKVFADFFPLTKKKKVPVKNPNILISKTAPLLGTCPDSQR